MIGDEIAKLKAGDLISRRTSTKSVFPSWVWRISRIKGSPRYQADFFLTCDATGEKKRLKGGTIYYHYEKV